jgi:poly-gamma-glutamate synthesis protein (capsule biosynthesis protein)
MKILIAGDYCPQDRIAKLIDNDEPVMSDAVVRQIKSVDYALVNFECAVADSTMKPIPKCGPHLGCTEKAVSVLSEAGFNGVTLANNHFRDYGSEGVKRTIEVLDNVGIDHVGGGNDIEEATAILYKQIKGKTVAFINICENEFSIADENRGGSAPLDTIDVCHRITAARKVADVVVVIIHGGHEHFQYPSPRMTKLYRFFIEVGADAVVNHHQHCYSGYEMYLGKPIVYGLGNFCFDDPKKRAGIWNEGYMVVLDFTGSGIQLELIPYIQCDEEPNVELMEGSKLQAFWQMVRCISDTINDEHLLQQEYNQFLKLRKQLLITPFTPYFNEYVQLAAGHHYLPYLIPKKKLAKMLGVISCESHRDILIESMREKLNK